MNNIHIQEKTLDVDGFSLAYTDIGPEDGHVVFCVHGLLSNGRLFDFLGLELAKIGYRVIAVDLPGRGRSQRFTDYTHYIPPNYIPYCFALIAHEVKGKDFCWLGMSLGATIGMALHDVEGLNMERFICVDIGPKIPNEAMERIDAFAKAPCRYGTKEEAITSLMSRCSGWGIEEDYIWDHLVAHSVIGCSNNGFCFNRDDGIGRSFDAKRENVDLWEVWEDIKQPTLLIRGGLSEILTEDIAQDMRARYNGEQFDEIVYEKCGHAPNLMQTEHLQDIAQWLGER